MEKDLETLLGELETAAYNHGYTTTMGQSRQAEQCRKAVEEVKQEIRDFVSKDD